MKHEVVRLSNVMIRRGRTAGGPFHLKINRGAITGVVVGESFEKDLITSVFTGKSVLDSGSFFYHGELVSPEDRETVIRRKVMKEVAIISGESRLFDSLSLVDNIFIPGFLVRTPKHVKVARELMAFFDLEIPLSKKPGDLNHLERIQVEILHAVANRRKLIFAVNINGKLRTRELKELYRFYDQLLNIGYAICLFEPPNTMPFEKLDTLTIIEKGRCVGEYCRPDIDAREIAGVVNAYSDPFSYVDLLALRDKKLYSGVRVPVMELKNLSYGKLKGITFDVHRGELVQVFCRTRSDYTEFSRILLGESGKFQGSILIGGKPMQSASIRKAIRRLQIGWLDFSLTDKMLFENLSLIENLCYPLSRKAPFFFMKKNNMKAAEDYIDRTGLTIDPYAEVRSLTHEQASRVALCKWLLCKPNLLFLFAPATFEMVELDSTMKKILLELCMYGIPVVIVSERYKLETDIIETEYVLSDGSIVRRS